MIQEATEALIRLIKQEVHSNCVLVSADDLFEVKRLTSVLLQGPTLTEHGHRRCPATAFQINQNDLTTKQGRFPRHYHLDYELIVTTGKEVEMLQMQEAVTAFLAAFPVLTVGTGTLNLTELVPLGSQRRVNLSNLHQCSGKIRIEDCPVFAGAVVDGKLISRVNIAFTGDVHSEINLNP